MTSEPLCVIGVGAEGPAGLSAEALDHVARASVLAGGRRLLDFFPDFSGEKIVIEACPETPVRQLRELSRQKKTVVLASGDPLFYGIGRWLLKVFPKEDLVFLPHLSSVQLAFARIKETWDDARVVSLHGRPMDHLLPVIRERAAKIAVLTDMTNTPAAVARLLEEQGAGEDYIFWVCEDLGGPSERVRRLARSQVQAETFSPLNLVILLRETQVRETQSRETQNLVGIPEDALRHRGELITKREVRLMALAYLELHANDVFWDIGAGSGSVAVETARLSPSLRVFAVEKSSSAVAQIEENVRNFGLHNVVIVPSEAPEVLADLPAPDAVFIGGSGGRLAEIIETVGERLKPGGRVVINCITLENFSLGWDRLRHLGFHPEVTSVQLAHSRPLADRHCLEPESMIFILRGRKP